MRGAMQLLFGSAMVRVVQRMGYKLDDLCVVVVARGEW